MSGYFLDASTLIASVDEGDKNHLPARALTNGMLEIGTLDLCYYETSNVAIRSWRDPQAAHRLRMKIDAIETDHITRVDSDLIEHAAQIAEQFEISVYDAAYVAAARRRAAVLVSCDERNLVSKGLAVLPETAVNP